MRGEPFQAFPKSGISPKVERFQRRVARDKVEDEKKAEVRKRDQYCRFPRCGCRRLHFGLAVAHCRHKGMGGNPAGDRSAPEDMILLCAPRHREHPIALDKGTLRVVPLHERRGFAGPCTFEVELPASLALSRSFFTSARNCSKVLPLRSIFKMY